MGRNFEVDYPDQVTKLLTTAPFPPHKSKQPKYMSQSITLSWECCTGSSPTQAKDDEAHNLAESFHSYQKQELRRVFKHTVTEYFILDNNNFQNTKGNYHHANTFPYNTNPKDIIRLLLQFKILSSQLLNYENRM